MALTVFIDLGTFTKEYGDNYLALIASSVEALAVKKVRVDTGNLKNSILKKPVGPYKWEVTSQAPYALAQEYGLGAFGKPKYGFTPYMRPAAKETEANLTQLGREAERLAKQKARVNRKYD